VRKLGIKTVRIDRLSLPGDFRDRLEKPHVGERAESIEKHGLLQYPLVRKADKLLISGCDRVAAHVKLGREEIDVEMVEATDNEVEEVRLVENVERRHEPDRQAEDIAKLIDFYAKREEEEADPEEPKKPGRPKKSTTKARERVARQKNVKAESIARQQRRKQERERKKAEAEAQEEAPPPVVIDLRGIPMSKEDLEAAAAVKERLTQADNKLRAAQTIITSIETDEMPFAEYSRNAVYDAIHDAAVAIRQMTPATACPFCKMIPMLRDNCVGCSSNAYLMTKQVEQVPDALWSMDKVLWASNIMPYDQAVEMSEKNGQPLGEMHEPSEEYETEPEEEYTYEPEEDDFGFGGDDD